MADNRHYGDCVGRLWTRVELVALCEKWDATSQADYWRDVLADGMAYCTGCDRIVQPGDSHDDEQRLAVRELMDAAIWACEMQPEGPMPRWQRRLMAALDNVARCDAR